MYREDYLKDYYKTLEEAPCSALEEYDMGLRWIMSVGVQL